MKISKQHKSRGFAWNEAGQYVTLHGQPVDCPVKGLHIEAFALDNAHFAWRQYWENPELPREWESEAAYVSRVGTGFTEPSHTTP